MWWIAGAAMVALGVVMGLGWQWKRRRDWVAHVDRLVHAPPSAGSVVAGASAEEHFLRGCAVLASGQPAAAAQHFQLAHHGDHAYEIAAILTFTCMKMAHEDMPQLLRILVQTLAQAARAPIPSCPREKEFLARIKPLSQPSEGGLSATGRMLWQLPIAPLRQQLIAAQEAGFDWAADLLTTAKSAPSVATAPA